MEGERSAFRPQISFIDIHILVVDDDPTSLAIVSAMLRTCKYQVVTVKNPFEALNTLRMKKGLFDLVISDLHMPQMNGLELQQKVEQEFNLPVVMISADEKDNVILESLQKGVAFYIVKPVRVDDLKHVWQHAVAAKKGKSDNFKLVRNVNVGNYMENASYNDVILSPATLHDGEKRNKLKRKASRWCKERYCQSPKKAKVVWTNSLHNRFLHAIRQIGLHKAVPKRILEFMNEPGLTRENVASHLQKYRIFLKRVTDDGSFPFKEFSDITSASSLASYLPSMVSKSFQPSHKDFPKHHINPRNPDFPSKKASISTSITHLGHEQVLNSSKFHHSISPIRQSNSHQTVNPQYLDDPIEASNIITKPVTNGNLSVAQSDSSASYTQTPDMFFNYPSTHFESTANSPFSSSSASNFSISKFSGTRNGGRGDNLVITRAQIGSNNTTGDESKQSLLPLVQLSPSQINDPRNEEVFKFDCIDQNQQAIDICDLFMEDNNNQSSFEQKDEEESLSDLYNVLNDYRLNSSGKEPLHSDKCSSFSSNSGSLIQDPKSILQLDENKDVRIGDKYKNCAVQAPHQPSQRYDKEIHGEEDGGLQINDPLNEGWDEDLLEILFGDNMNEKDLEIQLAGIFNKS